MARKREKLLTRLGPEAAAREVAHRWFTKRGREWADHYYDGIMNPSVSEGEYAENLKDWYVKLAAGRGLISVAFSLIKAGVSPERAIETLTALMRR